MIYVDSREPKTIKDLARSYLKEVEVTQLSAGDFVSGEMCIERKTVSDFIGSLNNNRLHNQIQHMKANFDHCFVIVVGPDWHIKKYCNISAKTLDARLMACSMDYDIKTGRVANDISFMAQAKTIFKRSKNNVDYIEKRLKRIAPRSDDKYVNMVCEVEGIGEKKAREVLKNFKVYELFEVTEKDLRGIKGIGKKQAEKIKEVFNK